MLTGFLLTLTGFAVLIWSAEQLVRHSLNLSRIFSISPALVGITVVAFGTSLPELVVSVLAALSGNSDIAVGNVVGSNVVNMGLVFGLISLFKTLPVHEMARKLDFPTMFGVALVFGLMLLGGEIGRLESGILLSLLVGYLVLTLKLAPDDKDMAEEMKEASTAVTQNKWVIIGWVAFSLVLIYIGGKVTLEGVLMLAREFGISERVIGLTVVAFGTSLPEFVSTLVAVMRGHASIALGTVIGSNIYNILGIIGTCGFIMPISVHPKMLEIDYWVMIAMMLVLFPAIFWKKKITKATGAPLLAIFLGYLWVLFAS